MALRASLTDEKIAKLKPAPAGQRYHMYDADQTVPGFGVRVTDKGPVSFILYTRFAPGKPPARTMLGKVGPMKLGQARSKAEQWLSMLEAGLDPRDEEREVRAAARLAKAGATKERRDLTFKGAAQAYMEHKRRAGHRRADVDEREINRHLVNRWGKKLMSEVTRDAAHRRLTEFAHALRAEGRAASLADAFRLASLLHPDLADLLAADIDERAARNLDTDFHASNRLNDDIGLKVRDYVAGDNGKTDPNRLRRFAEANSVWFDRYAALNLGGQMAAILGRLRPKAAKGLAIAFP